MKTRGEQMWESLRDPDFRKQLTDEHLNVGIAFQIRALRDRQNLTQSDLAKLLNAKQPLVSSWENPGYGKYSLKTLKAVAKAFDVGLLVRFVPFSVLADWTTNLSNDRIAPPSFAQENKTYTALQVSTSFVSTESKDRVSKATAAADFVNGLQILDKLSSTATPESLNNIEEGIHA